MKLLYDRSANVVLIIIIKNDDVCDNIVEISCLMLPHNFVLCVSIKNIHVYSSSLLTILKTLIINYIDVIIQHYLYTLMNNYILSSIWAATYISSEY